jgi:hypothetical protein
VLKSVFKALGVRLGKWVSPEKPCYRCGVIATKEFAGYHYCGICRDAVAAMISVVRHDPPYGFPGAQGYTEFPNPKKEAARG